MTTYSTADTDLHGGKIAIMETAQHTSVVVNLSVQQLNSIIGMDASLVFTEKIIISKSLFKTVLQFLSIFFSYIDRKFFHIALSAS